MATVKRLIGIAIAIATAIVGASAFGITAVEYSALGQEGTELPLR
jgi:hypothetical protein